MNNYSILVTDDDPSLRYIMRFGLSRSGMTVYEAVDGLDALKKVEQYRPHVILMDIMMPDMDGITTCRLLRQNPSNDGIPIIMLSASSKDNVVDECYKAGASGFLHKPVPLADLLKTVENILISTGATPATNSVPV